MHNLTATAARRPSSADLSHIVISAVQFTIGIAAARLLYTRTQSFLGDPMPAAILTLVAALIVLVTIAPGKRS